MKSPVVLLLLFVLLLGWTVAQADPGTTGEDADPQTPRSRVPRFRLILNRLADPQMGGLLPTTSARVQATAVHAALDDVLTELDNVAEQDQSANQSVSLGPEDDGKYLQNKI